MTDDEILHLLIAEALCRYIEDKHGESAWIIGGAVRNAMVSKPIRDVDIVTTMDIPKLSNRDIRVVTVRNSDKFGSYKVIYKECLFDVTRLRGEEVYEDGKLVEVRELADIEVDASRRDFGINTGYMRIEDPGKMIISDPLGLFWDALRDQEIRYVGDANTRIHEDPLRMLRGFRIAAEMDWNVSPRVYLAAKENAELINQISVERIRGELDKVLMSGRAYPAFLSLSSTGLLSFILPELHYAMDVKQNAHHGETVGEHLILTASAIQKDNLLLKWAALLHDIAKPKVKQFNKKKDDYTFYKHETKSAFDAKDILRRLKFTNKEIDYIFRLILNHMWFITDKTRLVTIRRRMHKIGKDAVRDVLRLRIADRAGNLAKNSKITRYLRLLLKLIRKVEQEERVEKIVDLRVNGHDMRRLGCRRKEIGVVLNYLHKRCIDSPSLNKRDRLLSIAKERLEDIRK